MKTVIVSQSAVLATSEVYIDTTNKVGNTEQIGFVKEDRQDAYSVWDEDWSK